MSGGAAGDVTTAEGDDDGNATETEAEGASAWASATAVPGRGGVSLRPQPPSTIAAHTTDRTSVTAAAAYHRLRSPSASRYSPHVIHVSHLTKRYGARVAVDDVSFDVAAGEVVGFLGPNGAGKSTTLRVLAGFLGPTDGAVTIAGHDVVDDSIEARRCVGYMPESVPLYPEMRVVEYLRFRAELKRVRPRERGEHVEEAMQKAGVVDVAHRRIGHLSKGYRQRVGLADAIVARPPIVILDEPTAGLDPNQIREARSLIRELAADRAVVLSTHILSEVEACATRVLLIHRGRLIAEGPTDRIRAMRQPTHFEVTVRGAADVAERALRGVPGVADVVRLDAPVGTARLRAAFGGAPHDGVDTSERAVAALVGAGLGVREMRSSGGSLEDVFAALTTDAREQA
jgi:ABC-2 type transport system ATP-binding protein